MRRLGLCVLLAWTAGCTYPPPKTDLFYGAQLIPPPSTTSGGTGTQQPPGEDYYNSPGNGGTGGTGTGGAGTGTGTGGSGSGLPSGSGGTSTDPNQYTPGGGFNYQGSNSSNPGGTGFRPVGDSGASSSRPSAPTTFNNGANNEATSGASSSAEDPFQPSTAAPRRMGPDDGIFSMPGSSGAGSSGTSAPQGSGSRYPPTSSQLDPQANSEPRRFVPPSETTSLGVRQASFSSDASTAANSRGSYGYDPSYAWLRGQLDYSASDHRWKLRYIPITGDTDDYGGSVILVGRNMDDFRNGEFVTVQGTLDTAEVERGGFAPTYKIQQISRVE